jgi:amino acid adenylation domain-containing protein
VAVLEQSLNEVVRRQESLRTTFVKVVGKPAQMITTQALAVPVKDLLHLSEAEREVEIQRLIEAEGRWSFDLAAGPLFRLNLLNLGESEHVALITMHHIISDGWSVAVLGQEVMSLYAALARADSQPSLPGLPIQYADFARWQREWFQSKFLGRQLNYWKKQLAGELPILELPADHVRPEKLTGGGASLRFRIPREQAFSIQALSRRENVTMFMLLLTAFKTLLYRYTGQRDLLVGSPIANRTRVETENLIGCFINPLVFRTDFSGNPTFREALRRVRDVALEAYANQDVPFENLVKELKLNRELRHMPVFQVLFILHNAPIQSIQPEGLTISSIETHNHASPFDVTMTVWATEPEIEISIEYKTDLFDATTIMRMRDHFQVLLGSVAADPDQTIATVPLLPEPERLTLLKEWSGTYKAPSQTACMHHLFEAQVLRSPDAIAVIAGDQTCTYLALNERANQLAHYLQQLGVRPEIRVGICLERSIEMLVGILGILKSGGAYVPLDPAYPPERLGAMLGDTDQTASGAISVILTQENLLEKLPIHQAHTVCLDRDWESIATHSRENPTSGVTPENLAYFIYTSGSTGTPKGVMVQHSSLVNYVQSAVEDYQLGPQERVLQFASISFDTSVEEIYPSLISGATLLLRTDSMLAISTFVEYCKLWKLTVLNLPTAFWHEWVAQMNTNALIMPDSIRLVIIGGERAIPEKVAAWYRQVGPNIWLVNTYGATEATAVTTLCDLSAGKAIAHEVPIGRPINNLSVYILDQELNPVPIGVPGELYIGGAGLARGYFGHPALTAERFIPNPMLDIGYSIGNSNVEYPISNIETRLYRTGDLARFLPNGEIEYLGRIDHLVKIRGFRIELGEIEAILSKHPQVQETVVVAYDDPLESVLRGAGKRLVAYIIPQKPLQPSASELRSFLESYLPKYMVPSAYVLMDSFPLTPTRKLDRRALPQPDFGRPEAETVYVAPRNEIERQISSIWQDALGIDKVGIYDNFFDLGGHSLLLVQVHSRLQESLETEISIIDLFQYPSIDALVSHLSKTQEQSAFQGSQDRAQKQRDAAQRQREQMQERRKQTIFDIGDDEL